MDERKNATGKNVEREAISIALTVAFEAPKFVCPPGTADHWPLDTDEEKNLIGRIEDVIAMLPKRKRTQAMKFIGKIMPPLALAVTGYMVTAPRVALTRELIQQLKRQNARIQNNTSTGGNSSGQPATQEPERSGPAFDPTSYAGNGRARRGPLDSYFTGDEALQ